jgi:hypothetical protein
MERMKFVLEPRLERIYDRRQNLRYRIGVNRKIK